MQIGSSGSSPFRLFRLFAGQFGSGSGRTENCGSRGLDEISTPPKDTMFELERKNQLCGVSDQGAPRSQRFT
jgi:hypothetical protein